MQTAVAKQILYVIGLFVYFLVLNRVESSPRKFEINYIFVLKACKALPVYFKLIVWIRVISGVVVLFVCVVSWIDVDRKGVGIRSVADSQREDVSLLPCTCNTMIYVHITCVHVSWGRHTRPHDIIFTQTSQYSVQSHILSLIGVWIIMKNSVNIRPTFCLLQWPPR